MTVAMLMQNTAISAERWLTLSRKRDISALELDLKEPVPSDIEIAKAQTPKHIDELCREIGLSASEVRKKESRTHPFIRASVLSDTCVQYELYGTAKAKINLDVLERLDHRKDGRYIVVTGYVTMVYHC